MEHNHMEHKKSKCKQCEFVFEPNVIRRIHVNDIQEIECKYSDNLLRKHSMPMNTIIRLKFE